MRRGKTSTEHRERAFSQPSGDVINSVARIKSWQRKLLQEEAGHLPSIFGRGE